MLTLCLVVLTGCADKIELEEEGFVLVIGIDLPEEGQTGLDITYQLADPLAGDPGSQPGSEEFKTITIRMPDLISARDMLNVSETRNINFYHTKALVVSEAFARSDKFLGSIGTLGRDPEVRRDMILLVSKERASDYLRNNKPVFEASPHKFYDFISRRWDTNALVPKSDLQTVLHDIEADSGLALATYTTAEEIDPVIKNNEDNYLPGELYKKGGTPVQLIGSAAFRGGKMIGTLTGEEVRIKTFLSERLNPQDIAFTFPDPIKENFRVTGKVTNTKTNVKVDVSKPKPIITVDAWLDVRILSIPSMINYVDNLEKQEQLDQHIEERFQLLANRLVKKTQEELKAEAFNWSLTARRKFLNLQQYQKYDWMKAYPDAEVKVNMHVNLEGFGKLLRPRDKEEIRD
ncbi:Ger(x)C family spore germination protein [Bacillus sp. SG-1]|uniref:Ger(x)C family spore germination protein n=1 Tax=Bacillus sp. SG-1 TaxID=161544 RepID=UPI0018DC0337|nr:Ger(x)C family spore germination protein [Bacillus sp. SG-1]